MLPGLNNMYPKNTNRSLSFFQGGRVCYLDPTSKLNTLFRGLRKVTFIKGS